MKSAPLPLNELDRLQSLREHELLDTLPEDLYDDITRIATQITGTPTALLTLVDKDRQWFKSRQRFDVGETAREYSFCAHAIIDPDVPLVVEDARNDERFHDNPYTIGQPHIIFYAGVPISDAEGRALGTLCVIDNQPRKLTSEKLESLKALAKLAKTHFELRKTKMDLDKAQEDLKMVQSLVNTMQEDLIDLVQSEAPVEQVQDLTTALELTVDSIKDIKDR